MIMARNRQIGPCANSEMGAGVLSWGAWKPGWPALTRGSLSRAVMVAGVVSVRVGQMVACPSRGSAAPVR